MAKVAKKKVLVKKISVKKSPQKEINQSISDNEPQVMGKKKVVNTYGLKYLKDNK